MDWRKSSYSGGNGGQCVETATGNGVVLVRDTTNRSGGTLALGAGAWQAFTSKIKNALQETPSRADPSGAALFACSGRHAAAPGPSAGAPSSRRRWHGSPAPGS